MIQGVSAELAPCEVLRLTSVGSCVYKVNQILPHSSRSSVHGLFGGNEASRHVLKL